VAFQLLHGMVSSLLQWGGVCCCCCCEGCFCVICVVIAVAGWSFFGCCTVGCGVFVAVVAQGGVVFFCCCVGWHCCMVWDGVVFVALGKVALLLLHGKGGIVVVVVQGKVALVL